MFARCLVSILGIIVAAKAASAQSAPPKAPADPGEQNTQPQPPRAKAQDPLRVFPGSQVPVQPERYVWKISGKIPNSTAAPRSSVPVLTITDGSTHVIGQIPVGTEIKLETFTHLGRTIFYAVPFTAPEDVNAKVKLVKPLAWVSGLFIEPSAFTPVAK